MSDTAATATPTKREAIAVRDWIDANGSPIETGKESDAIGFRYTHLPSAKRINPAYNPETDAAPAEAFYEHAFPAVGEPVTADLLMCAIFGGLTLAGNIVNTTTKGKGDPNLNPIPTIAARLKEIESGIWTDREAGGGGVRYDKEKLAAAIASAKGETDPAPYLAKMDLKVDPKSGATVPNDTKGAISYGAFAKRIPKVQEAYNALTGGGVSLSSL